MFRGLYRRAVPYTSSRVLKRFRPSRGRAGVSLGLGGRVDGCEVRPFDPCARVRPCVPCVPCLSRVSRDPCGARVSRVSEITHRHTFTFTQSLHSRSRLPRCLFTGSRYREEYRYPVLCPGPRTGFAPPPSGDFLQSSSAHGLVLHKGACTRILQCGLAFAQLRCARGRGYLRPGEGKPLIQAG